MKRGVQYFSSEAPQCCDVAVVGSGKTEGEYGEVRYVGMYTREALLRRIFGETSANQRTAIPCGKPRVTGRSEKAQNQLASVTELHQEHNPAQDAVGRRLGGYHGLVRGTDERSATPHSECVKHQSQPPNKNPRGFRRMTNSASIEDVLPGGNNRLPHRQTECKTRTAQEVGRESGPPSGDLRQTLRIGSRVVGSAPAK